MGNGAGAAEVAADESFHDVHGGQQHIDFPYHDGVHDGMETTQGAYCDQFYIQKCV